MFIDLVCDGFPDEQAEELSACLDVLERGGLFDLLREDTGARRLLPRGVRDSLLRERETVRALLAYVERGEVDPSMLRVQRDGWGSMSDGTSIEVRDDRPDAVCLVESADNASFDARDRWGTFLLAVGVAVGMACGGERPSSDPKVSAERPGADPATVTGAVALAADWCDERSEVEALRRG
jgi:hypothetical protein